MRSLNLKKSTVEALLIGSLIFLSQLHAKAQIDSIQNDNKLQSLLHFELGQFTAGASAEFLKYKAEKKWSKGLKFHYGYIPMNRDGFVNIKYIFISNKEKNALPEFGLGPCLFLEPSDRERFPPVAFHAAYRFQKPKSRIIARIGTGFPDLILNGSLAIRLR